MPMPNVLLIRKVSGTGISILVIQSGRSLEPWDTKRTDRNLSHASPKPIGT